MTPNNAFATRTCIVGVVVTNEFNTHFLEAGNLNGSNADMCRMWLGGLVAQSSSTTGRHLGFERDHNFHNAFRGVLRHHA